jgi:hypothetical protein
MWELRSSLAAEHGKLMAQDKELTILGGIAAAEQGEQLDRAAQRQVRESWQHGVASAVGAAERHASKPRSK